MAVFGSTRARLAKRSFDYQWASLPEGRGLASDPAFAARVDEIVAREQLLVAKEWFAGRRVLDAGCGNGRWIEGFLRLGCEVTAIDASAHGLEHARNQYGDRARFVQADVLRADEALAGEKFDLVWSWGVLHHTEDTAGGIRTLARLMEDDGLMFLYLYGKASVDSASALKLGAIRIALNMMPLRTRRSLLEWRYGPERAHEIFDGMSTPLNDRFTFEEASAMCAAAGLPRVTRTLDHTELFIRADHGASSADGLFTEPPPRPYWFESITA